jgi:hypothetical protein
MQENKICEVHANKRSNTHKIQIEIHKDDDEDMTRMDTNIIRIYLGRAMDDEYVICLCTTIRAKDKVSSFLYYLFTYFQNRLLPKNIIIIRNYGDDDGVLKDRHGGERTSKGRPTQVRVLNNIKFESTSDSRTLLHQN